LSEEVPVTDRAAQLAEFVTAHVAAFDSLLAATADLDDKEWALPTGCPGWDVHDQLAHCIGVERRMLGDPEPEVEVPDLPHVRHPVAGVLERDVAVRRGLPGDQLRAEAQETFDRRLEMLRAVDPSSMDDDTVMPLGVMRLSQALRMRLFDLSSHERDIRAPLGRLEDFGGPHVELAIEQVLRSWAKTLPSRIETAGTITFAVGGGAPVALDLGAGTLGRTADVPATPDAAVGLSAAQLLALAGGRDDAPHLGDLEVEGDTQLVEQLRTAGGITP
jgi:uncharacterized protein (TIGR03083 family)